MPNNIFCISSAPSVQNGWSRQLGVNLLVSGYHLPENAKLGSGIYRGFSDLGQKYVFNPDSGNRIIVSEIETIAAADGVQRPRSKLKAVVTSAAADLSEDEHTQTNKNLRRKHHLYYDDISNYENIVLVPSTLGEPQMVDLCYNEQICCSLNYTFTSSLNYSLLAYSGKMLQGGDTYAMYIQVCAVVWCKTENVSTCSHINDGLPTNDKFHIHTLYGNFTTKYVYPIALTRNLTLVDNNFYSVNTNRNIWTLKMQDETHNLLSVGIFGRWYSKDPSDEISKTVFESLISLVIRWWNLLLA